MNIVIDADVSPDRQVVPNASGRGYHALKAWQAHLGCFAGYHRNQAEAKRALAANITQFATEVRPPEFIEFQGLTAVVWCQPSDLDAIFWCYKVIGPTAGYTGTETMVRRREQAISSARWHLADGYAMGDFWDAERIETAAAFLDAGTPDDCHTSRDLRRSCAFQRSYRWAESFGEADPHRWTFDHRDEYLDRFDRPNSTAA